ncbi:MAG: hypothetical protein U1B83_09415 [Candidatus Cloacimonadaceae bacterium]|nr:hypothetical protein [Candidatus Cloacimonadaceae bacterium]
MARKDKKIILMAQCLINPYCRVHILGQNFPLTQELTEFLLKRRIGIVQYPCPETTAMGLMRNPMGRQQYDNIFFREHCKELLKVPMLMAREFVKNNYRLVAYIGLENSPTCGINWGKHKVNRYGTESPMTDDNAADANDPVLRGIMAEILEQELSCEGITIPFIECPAQSMPDSDKRKAFWDALEEAIAPVDT